MAYVQILRYIIFTTILSFNYVVAGKTPGECDAANSVVAEQDGKKYCVHTNIPKSERMKTPEMIQFYGHEYEEIDVTTEDDYILKLFHIKGNRSKDPPLLLMHGALASSDCFLVRGKESLAINLADSGYDVWLGNIRGNKYSRKHRYLNPDRDTKFWDFDFHENGYYDNPALIDFILNATGKPQLVYVGHSQGTLTQFVTGATRSEYNHKVKLFIALAPVFYTEHVRGLSTGTRFGLPALYLAFKATGQVEILNENSTLRRTIQDTCTEDLTVGYELCAGIFFGIFGADPKGFEPAFLPIAVGHYFAGTSRQNVAHGAQLFNNHYGWFDYGPVENMIRYNSPVAPLYDVSKITTKVVLMVGRNDFIADTQDNMALRDALPNVEYFEMPHDIFNHLDFVWGRYMNETFFPYFYQFLNKYK